MKILHAKGQTGNKFFTYLHYLADSMESGEKIVVLAPDRSLRNFPNFQRSKIIGFPFYSQKIAKIIGYENYLQFLITVFGNKYSLKVLSVFFRIIPRINFVVAPTGSYKSPLVPKYEDELKHIFTPHLKTIEEVNSTFKKFKKQYDIICGVHIRRGDYKYWNAGKYFYSLNQYHKLMLKIQELFPGQSVAFFISSNEKIDLHVFEGCSCFNIPEANATKDLYGLSICDYILGPPSTFSGWASYYGNTPLYFIENPDDELTLSTFKHIMDIWK